MFFRSAVQKAWQCILAKEADATSEKALVELFSETDYLESQQFTKLHKIVLKLIPTDLEQELEVSTSTIDSIDSTERTALAWASARYVILSYLIKDHHMITGLKLPLIYPWSSLANRATQLIFSDKLTLKSAIEVTNAPCVLF